MIHNLARLETELASGIWRAKLQLSLQILQGLLCPTSGIEGPEKYATESEVRKSKEES